MSVCVNNLSMKPFIFDDRSKYIQPYWKQFHDPNNVLYFFTITKEMHHRCMGWPSIKMNNINFNLLNGESATRSAIITDLSINFFVESTDVLILMLKLQKKAENPILSKSGIWFPDNFYQRQILYNSIVGSISIVVKRNWAQQ